MPVGTPFHPRTAALCTSLSWRDWAGYFAVSTYEVNHDREYSAIRNAAALIDVSPLFKYRVSGSDATRLVDRVVTRDVAKMAVGQVAYTHWCDGDGKVIDDGTVSRLGPELYRWTAAEPNLRWIRQNAHGLQVEVEDVSERLAAVALQGPTSRDVLRSCTEPDISSLKYFRVMPATIRGIPVEISRTGYTGDLGYEIWVDADKALALWDALMESEQAWDITPRACSSTWPHRGGPHPAVVDYERERRSSVAEVLAVRDRPRRLVHLEKAPYVGQAALRRDASAGTARALVGLDVVWADVERLHDEAGLAPQLPATASRVSVPVFRDGVQVGRASSSTWSPTLKKMIALATVARDAAAPGTRLEMELTVDHRRRVVGVTVAKLPFFDPPRKRSTDHSVTDHS
jgi:aminomethyltransferase